MNPAGGPAPDIEREALLSAALELSGTTDYRAITVEELAAAGGTTRSRFRQLFASVEDCYASAYEEWAVEFGRRFFEQCEGTSGWTKRLRASLEWLIHYAREEPSILRGVIAQGPAAGERVQNARRRLLERLSHAVDSARRETDLSRHSPPPATAAFIVGGIAWAVESSLRKSASESLEERAPDLVFFAVMPYFGEEVAWVERSAMKTEL